MPATAATGHLPDYASLPAEILDRTTVAYLCSPANPQGAVASRAYWAELLALAEKHDFVIFADECYCEIWRTAPPPGILDVAAQVGADPERVFSFHSLSKRSNLPGLRSGFVAGGAKGITQIRKLRAFAGAPVPLPVQRVSEAAWRDEAHVITNQALYREKFIAAEAIFSGLQGFAMPEGGFFLWLRSGSARGLSVARCHGGKPRHQLHQGGAGRPQRRNAAGAYPASRLPLRLKGTLWPRIKPVSATLFWIKPCKPCWNGGGAKPWGWA